MVRNQIYTTEEQDKELRLMVAMGDGYYSELVRQGIDLLIQRKKKKVNDSTDWDKWKSFVGVCKNDFNGKSGQDLINDYYENDVV